MTNFNLNKNSSIMFRDKPGTYIIISISISLLFFFIGLEPNGFSKDKLFKITGDSGDYIHSAENLIKNNEFSFYKTTDDLEIVSNFRPKEYNKSIFYAFRTPGFSILYLPFRIFFNQNTSIILYLLLQVVIVGIAKYQLAKISEFFSKSKTIFLITFFGILFLPMFTRYNNLILTDSLGVAFLIFGIHYFHKYLSFPEKKHLYIVSLFLCISFLLRPFVILFFPYFFFALLIKNQRNIKFTIVHCLQIFAIIGIIQTAWIIRNYNLTNKFIPIAGTMEFQDHKHKSFYHVRTISKHLGTSMNWWDKSSPVNWFYSKNSKSFNEVFKDLNVDPEISIQIDKAKELYQNSVNQDINLNERKKSELASEKKVIEATNSLRDLGIYSFTIKPFIKQTTTLLTAKNIRLFNSWNYPFNVALVFIQSFLKYSITIAGLLFSIFLIFNFNKSPYLSLFSIFSLFLLIFFSWLHSNSEDRYILTNYFLFTPIVFGSFGQLIKTKLGKLIISFSFLLIISAAINAVITEIKW